MCMNIILIPFIYNHLDNIVYVFFNSLYYSLSSRLSYRILKWARCKKALQIFSTAEEVNLTLYMTVQLLAGLWYKYYKLEI